MKELLLNSISKIKLCIKTFIIKSEKYIKLEGRKSEVIKIMLDSVITEKEKESTLILSELNAVRKDAGELNKKIQKIKEENIQYHKRNKSFKAFKIFLIDNRQ